MKIIVERGDITKCSVDVIVNAAKPTLLGGGGVDGAIHRAAGPGLLAECRELPLWPDAGPNIRCITGGARITKAHNLPAKFVVHTVGPIYADYEPDKAMELLAQAYYNSLVAAVDSGGRSIAFPAISCGVYGYPLDDAATIAIAVAMRHVGQTDVPVWDIDEIHFVLFEEEVFDAFEKALQIHDPDSNFNKWRAAHQSAPMTPEQVVEARARMNAPDWQWAPGMRLVADHERGQHGPEDQWSVAATLFDTAGVPCISIQSDTGEEAIIAFLVEDDTGICAYVGNLRDDGGFTGQSCVLPLPDLNDAATVALLPTWTAP